MIHQVERMQDRRSKAHLQRMADAEKRAQFFIRVPALDVVHFRA